MKTKYLLIAFLGFLCACTPEANTVLDFEYKVDKVVCQANSNYFVADGVSRLGLEVLLYTRQQATYTDVNGVEQPIYREIPQARWRNHDIKFFDRSGKEYSPDFTSTTLEPGVMEFYAEVDGIRSSKPVLQLLAEHPESGTPIAEEPEPVFFKMNVRAAKPIPTLKRIPVIFHIIDTETARNYQQELNSNAVYYVIDLYNNTFGRKISTASNGANTNIEFVPALRAPNGNLLKEPGINRVYLTESQNGSSFSKDFVFSRADMYWDYDKYLNIWIVSSSGWNSTSIANRYSRSLPFVFTEGVYDADKLPLPVTVTVQQKDEAGLAAWKVNPAYLENVGIVFHKNSDGFARLGPEYVSQMSAYFGVIPNYSVNESTLHYGSPRQWVDDYCDDTFIYNPYYADKSKGGIEGTNLGNASVKYTVALNEAKNGGTPAYPWIIYNSLNTGEQSSVQSVITQDQASRIEWTLNNAVARQMWRNSYAIDPVE